MKNLKIKKIVLLMILVITSIVIISCEDPIPTEYIPETYIEGILLVDQPIKNIVVMRTQPVFSEFNYDSTLIRNARVRIMGDNKIFDLSIAPSGKSGYYSIDSSYRVKPNTKYSIEITMPDNTIITGETSTPPKTEWNYKTAHPLQYPVDTLTLPDRDSIEWANVPGYPVCLLTVRCLDTLNYGKYLSSPTEEKNRRIFRSFENDRMYYEISSYAFIPNNKSFVVWNIFKWYGPHEVTVYVPDWNYLRWFKQYAMKSRYDDNLGTLKNGKGFFGSASMIKDTVLLLKNQP